MRLALWVAAALVVPAAALTQVKDDPTTGADSLGQNGQPTRQELKVRVEGNADRALTLQATRAPDGDFALVAPDTLAEVHSLFGTTASGPTVTVHIDNQPVRAALRQVFAAAHEPYVVDNDVPDSARVSVDAANVRLSTVLQLVTEAAGVGWRREVEGGKTTYRIGKGMRNGWAPFITRVKGPQGAIAIQEFADQLRNGLASTPMAYVMSAGTQRSSVFTCPHCKGQVTVLRKVEQPKCPKCGRIFMGDWQFCPVDGTKRPATTGTWKFCPLCGRAVEPQ